MLVSRDGREIGPMLDVFVYNIIVLFGIILVVALLVRFSGQSPQKLDLIPTSCVLCVCCVCVCVCTRKQVGRGRQRGRGTDGSKYIKSDWDTQNTLTKHFLMEVEGGERNVLSISIRSDWITLVKKRDLPALSQYVVLESADFAQFERFLYFQDVLFFQHTTRSLMNNGLVVVPRVRRTWPRK